MFLQREEKTPTSTTYHPAINFNTKAYTIRKKIEPAENKWLKKVPGPGNYSYLELTNERNKKIISKYSSAASAKFGNSERGSLASKSIAPGPGQRKLFLILDDIISPNFDESVFDKPYSSKIGNSQRKALKEMNVPGPGSYEVFSEFSH